MNKVIYLSLLSLAVLLLGACTSEPSVEFDADTAVPLSMVEDLQLSDTSDLDVEDCLGDFLAIAEPAEVTEGDVIPADFALYIDLDQVYLSYDEFSLEPVCNKLNWGIFRTTGNVELPTDAEVWSIDMDA